MNYYNKHYIRTDDESNIIHGFSDAFEPPQEGDILINEQGGRQFELLGGDQPADARFTGQFLVQMGWGKSYKSVMSVFCFCEPEISNSRRPQGSQKP